MDHVAVHPAATVALGRRKVAVKPSWTFRLAGTPRTDVPDGASSAPACTPGLLAALLPPQQAPSKTTSSAGIAKGTWCFLFKMDSTENSKYFQFSSMEISATAPTRSLRTTMSGVRQR
jgi:hypothetical protein